MARKNTEESTKLTGLTSQGSKPSSIHAGHKHQRHDLWSNKKSISKINIEMGKEIYLEKERRRESYLEQQTQQLQDARERGNINNKKEQ